MASLNTRARWYIAVLVIGAFVVLLGLFWWWGPPPHAHTPRFCCINNVRQIGLAVHQYAMENEGRFPDSYEILLKEGYLTTTKVFVCPSSDDRYAVENYPADYRKASLEELKLAEHNCSYTMIGGLNLDDLPPDFILVCDKSEDNHNGEGRNLWFNDGHVKWHLEEQFQEMMDAQQAKLGELRRQAEPKGKTP